MTSEVRLDQQRASRSKIPTHGSCAYNVQVDEYMVQANNIEIERKRAYLGITTNNVVRYSD